MRLGAKECYTETAEGAGRYQSKRGHRGGKSTGPWLVGGAVHDAFRDQCGIIKDSGECSNVGITSHAARGALCVLA